MGLMSFTSIRPFLLLLALLLAFPLNARASITVYPRVGSATDDTNLPKGPGLILMGGGTDVDAAFVWMHDVIVAGSGKGGDIVVLRATGTNAYDSYIYGLASFNSVQTLLIPSPASTQDLATAKAIVEKAEGVFFAGGNQADYVSWKGSLMTAVAGVHARGGVIGGTSAGLAIMGQFVFDAVAAGSSTVATSDATANPYESIISFTRGLFLFAPLANVITDPHFITRDRMGRLAAFMARQIADGAVTLNPPQVLGIGVDEKNAIVIDSAGKGKLLQYTSGTGAAFLMQAGPASQITSGKTLSYPDITVMRLDQAQQSFDFLRWCGTGKSYALGVDGSKSPVYTPSNPYTAAGTVGNCPPEADGGVSGDGGGSGHGDAAAGGADAARADDDAGLDDGDGGNGHHTASSCQMAGRDAPGGSIWCLGLLALLGSLGRRRMRPSRR